jgi:hypothetical protein
MAAAIPATARAFGVRANILEIPHSNLNSMLLDGGKRTSWQALFFKFVDVLAFFVGPS